MSEQEVVEKWGRLATILSAIPNGLCALADLVLLSKAFARLTGQSDLGRGLSASIVRGLWDMFNKLSILIPASFTEGVEVRLVDNDSKSGKHFMEETSMRTVMSGPQQWTSWGLSKDIEPGKARNALIALHCIFCALGETRWLVLDLARDAESKQGREKGSHHS